jgi:hypothetical protein
MSEQEQQLRDDTVAWFGPSWGAPVNQDCPQVDVPVGAPCMNCEREVGRGERGIVAAGDGGYQALHLRCLLEQVLGRDSTVVDELFARLDAEVARSRPERGDPEPQPERGR